MLLALLLPARLTLHVAGDPTHGFAIDLRWRVLVVHGRRVLRAPARAAATRDGAGDAPTPAAPTATARTPAAPAARPTRPSARERLREVERWLDVARRVLRSGALRIDGAHGRIELALGDVGETGRAFGWLCALATLVDPRGAVAIVPLWDRKDDLALDLSLDVRAYPLRLALILVPELWRARRRKRAGVGGDATVAAHAA